MGRIRLHILGYLLNLIIVIIIIIIKTKTTTSIENLGINVYMMIIHNVFVFIYRVRTFCQAGQGKEFVLQERYFYSCYMLGTPFFGSSIEHSIYKRFKIIIKIQILTINKIKRIETWTLYAALYRSFYPLLCHRLPACNK